MRLLDEQHDLFALGVALEEVIVDPVHHFDAVGVFRYRQLQFERDRVQDLVARNTGVGEIHGFDVVWQPRLQHAAQHGFAAAYLTRYLDDAFALRDGVDQRFEDRAAIAAVEEHVRIRRDLERRLRQAEEAVVHAYLSSRGTCS